MTTRHFTREQLEQIGVPFELDGDDTCATELSDQLVGSERWTDVHRLVFRAPDTGDAYQVDYEVGSTEQQDGIDPWHRYGKTIPAVEVEQRPVVTQQWRPVDAPRDPGLDTVLPAWEAMYEPGNVSDYLIGYANSEAAAKGAAEAWLRSEKADRPPGVGAGRAAGRGVRPLVRTRRAARRRHRHRTRHHRPTTHPEARRLTPARLHDHTPPETHMTDPTITDLRREIVLREINQGALAGMHSEITGQAADLVLAALDRYDTWAAGKVTARLARIAEAHSKDASGGGLTSGLCAECGQPWGKDGCPTRVWASTDRDPLATWDPADDEPQLEPCSACLLPKGDAPVERCIVEGPHDTHVTVMGRRWTDAHLTGEGAQR
jgi:hypothetical protein